MDYGLSRAYRHCIYLLLDIYTYTSIVYKHLYPNVHVCPVTFIYFDTITHIDDHELHDMLEAAKT